MKKVKKISPSRKKIIINLAVSAAVLVALILLIFYSGQFVGKAFGTSIDAGLFAEGSGGPENTLTLPLNPGSTFTLQIGANLGSKESVAYEFELDHPNFLEVVSVKSALIDDWEDTFFRVTKNSNKVKVEHATFDFSKVITGPVHLADITFKVKSDAGLLTGATQFDLDRDIIIGDPIDKDDITLITIQSLDEDNINQLNLGYLTVLDIDSQQNIITAVAPVKYDVAGEDIGDGGQGQASPRQILKAKLVALLDEQCYTDNRYCDVQGNFIIDYNNFNAGEKIKLLAQISTALGEFFREISP